jgi:hypothetical protein
MNRNWLPSVEGPIALRRRLSAGLPKAELYRMEGKHGSVATVKTFLCYHADINSETGWGATVACQSAPACESGPPQLPATTRFRMP